MVCVAQCLELLCLFLTCLRLNLSFFVLLDTASRSAVIRDYFFIWRYISNLCELSYLIKCQNLNLRSLLEPDQGVFDKLRKDDLISLGKHLSVEIKSSIVKKEMQNTIMDTKLNLNTLRKVF